MKKTVLFIIVTALACSAMAFATKFYHNWRTVQQESTAVLIARCEEVPEGWRVTNGVIMDNPSQGFGVSKMKMVVALKGTNVPPGTPFLLGSESAFVPRQYEYYLIMAQTFEGQECRANEAYRIIPMGLYFQTNDIAGKTPDEVVQYAMEGRIDRIKREIPALQAEQQRLEAALQELKSK